LVFQSFVDALQQISLSRDGSSVAPGTKRYVGVLNVDVPY
jgi:hypothetical protein